MSTTRKTYKLEDICSNITDGAHASPREVIDGTRIIATVKDMTDFGFNLDQCKRISELDFNSLKSSGCVPYEGDVLFSKDGTIGKILYYNSNLEIGVLSSIAIFRPNNEIIDSKYLSLYLREKSINKFISDNYRSGSAIPRIILRDLRKFELTIPPLPEQHAIVSILSALDDKIELNLQMNKTLEEMAMALYKHWFVDFGPFRDREFVPSELGEIPKGWEVKGILEVAELLSGGTPKTNVPEYWDGEINWVSAKDIGNGGVIYINETEKTVSQLGVKNSASKVLPEDTVILVARGSVGKYGMIAKPMAMNQSCYGLYTTSEFSQGLVYLMLSQLIEQFKRVAYGSVFDTITTSTFNTTKVVFPPKEIVKQLKSRIDPLFLKLKENTLENQTLTTLRDTLHPKLISGEVRVKDAARALAEVV